MSHSNRLVWYLESYLFIYPDSLSIYSLSKKINSDKSGNILVYLSFPIIFLILVKISVSLNELDKGIHVDAICVLVDPIMENLGDSVFLGLV